MPIAAGPAVSPIALRGSRREKSHDVIILEQYENAAPLLEKLEKITATYPNGRTYSGQIKKGLFHGYGKLSFASGKIYTGDFKDGIMHGFGKLTFSNGYYTGEFRKGKVYGRGMMTYSDGRTPLVGIFSQEPLQILPKDKA